MKRASNLTDTKGGGGQQGQASPNPGDSQVPPAQEDDLLEVVDPGDVEAVESRSPSPTPLAGAPWPTVSAADSPGGLPAGEPVAVPAPSMQVPMPGSVVPTAQPEPIPAQIPAPIPAPAIDLPPVPAASETPTEPEPGPLQPPIGSGTATAAVTPAAPGGQSASPAPMPAPPPGVGLPPVGPATAVPTGLSSLPAPPVARPITSPAPTAQLTQRPATDPTPPPQMDATPAPALAPTQPALQATPAPAPAPVPPALEATPAPAPAPVQPTLEATPAPAPAPLPATATPTPSGQTDGQAVMDGIDSFVASVRADTRSGVTAQPVPVAPARGRTPAVQLQQRGLVEVTSGSSEISLPSYDETTDPAIRMPAQPDPGDAEVHARAQNEEPTDPSIAAARSQEKTDPSIVPSAPTSAGETTDPSAQPGPVVNAAATSGAAAEWHPLAHGDADEDEFDGGMQDTVVLDPAMQDRLMALRGQQDKLLKERFGGEVTVMFTDLVGSTGYYERHGDIAGRQKMLTHNALLFPIVRSHDGTIIKTIGDSIMACFADAKSCLSSAEEMQRALQSHNRGCSDKDDEIHIRVGINAGPVIAEDGDLHGDAVNVASRVQAAANGGDILATESVVEQVPEREFEKLGPIVFKGKADPINVFRLPWGTIEGELPEETRVIATRYRLQEQIARGPVGIVYGAYDLRLQVPVAIKLLHRFVIDSNVAAQRLQQRIQTMASLLHNGIVRVLDCSPLGADEPFYVADRIDGPDLALWVARNGVPEPRRAVRIVRELCDAVIFAHRRGVVHGNIKPENVIVGPGNQPVLCDFGMGEVANVTQPGTPMSSPAYKAPEQVSGARMDARTDVYGLGALLYFLFTGRAPYESVATLKAMRAVVSGLYRRLGRLRPDLPEALHRVSERAMAAARESRYATVEDLAAALDPFCSATSPSLDTVAQPVIEDGDGGHDDNNDPAKEPTFVGLKPTADTPEKKAAATTHVGAKPRPPTRGSFLRDDRSLRWALGTVSVVALGAIIALGWNISGSADDTIPLVPAATARSGATNERATARRGSRDQGPTATEGILILTTEPWAEVFVNHQRIGRTPDVRVIWLTPGKHRLLLSNPRTQAHSELIEIRAGQRIRRRIKLKPARQ